MISVLTYHHTRNLFKQSEFLPFVKKYFRDVKYLGTESGNWSPRIRVSNWDEVKYELPKYAIPAKVELDSDNMTVLEALSLGQLGLAREIRGENNVRYSKNAREWT